MNRPSKKHHFVPQAQLRHFAGDTDERFIFVFDKQTDRSFRTSILNAGSENDFNTVSLGESKWNFEDLFRDVDSRSARLVGNILSHRSLAWFAVDDRLALADSLPRKCFVLISAEPPPSILPHAFAKRCANSVTILMKIRLWQYRAMQRHD
ncbi:hypothetical protein A4A58_15390 [Tardiphaga robiniae]|uniref:DUF4238 domain-containing protein n=1 Tax=Tardiphaga robiniae TaxID=943830 RepID=A0A163XNY4_9BRAD|nr:DUF4238 domain-containing protein [Tardiphaga robiniae]KZD21159.1 hypothetical protein A4A58_15390 [Tardiphaga robiniae]